MAQFRKPAFAVFAASLVLSLGACSMRSENELMEERIQRAEAAARKAVAAQQAAEEALDKIHMEARDRVSPDEEQQREAQAGATANDPNQVDSQNGPAPDA